ncbi:hypothetical protein [Aneurinibacillus tyrosinisolvens]|uniref:hypothetical protein n=1 Tax=Aneurinibacillus tyrosinisolvens TaxID=1443435 RepID=UPI00069C5B6C|nr:hypothetical protein [Aneurinibacillus tyrosinisolvens]
MLPRQLIAEEYPDAVQVKDFAAYLKEQTGHPCKIGIEAALAGWGLSEQHLSILLYHMENLGWIQQLERRREGWEFTLTALPPAMYQTLYDAIYRRREKRYDRLEEIKRWVQSVKCRREAIGSYFSQSHTGALAFCCDRCGIDYAFYEKKETDVQAPAQEWNWEDELDVLLPLA